MSRRRLGIALGAVLLLSAAAADQGTDGAVAHIRAVMGDPAVIAAISRWGLSPADVQHDIDAMAPRDRARLADLLTRRWPENATQDQAAQQAQFLVTLSLLRESTLFASVVSRRPRNVR